MQTQDSNCPVFNPTQVSPFYFEDKIQSTLDRRSSILDAEKEALTGEPCLDPCRTLEGD